MCSAQRVSARTDLPTRRRRWRRHPAACGIPLVAAAVLLALSASVRAQGRGGRGPLEAPGGERLLRGEQLEKHFPGVTFRGDVRVAPEASIAPGAMLLQHGGQPLEIRGRSRIDAKSQLTQHGSGKLVISDTHVTASKLGGHGTIERSQLTRVHGDSLEGLRTSASTLEEVQLSHTPSGSIARSKLRRTALSRFVGKLDRADVQLGFLAGRAEVNDADVAFGAVVDATVKDRAEVRGLVVGSSASPLAVAGERVDAFTVRTSPGLRAEVRSWTKGGVETRGVRVVDEIGASLAAQVALRRDGQPSYEPSAIGGEVEIVDAVTNERFWIDAFSR